VSQLSGAEALVRMLQQHGVTHIFGLCGDTSLPVYDALYRQGHGITHVLTRDERSAAYMADGYARTSGRVGVCEGPSGGGATYILPGVVEANESSVPVLAITTDIATGSRGRYALTELDQEALFRPLTKWNRVVGRAGQVPGAVRAAFRAMTTGRPGAAHIGLPFDVQREAVDETEVWGGCQPGRVSCASRRARSGRDRGGGAGDPRRAGPGLRLRRRARDRGRRGRAPPPRGAPGSAGRDHGQRPGQHPGDAPAGAGRDRQQRRRA
jgi:acetolactate synthase-1/2/3 large subunit